MRLYLLGEQEPASSMLYGEGPTSLCRYAEMAQCERVQEALATGNRSAASSRVADT